MILLIILLFAVWNGLAIRWQQTGKGSALWHAVGFAVRGLLIVPFLGDWLILLIALNVSWTAYDMIINLVNGWTLFYYGKTSWIDRNLGKWILVCKIMLLLFTVFYIIYSWNN